MCRHVHAVTAQGRTLKVKNMAKRYAWRFDDGAYIQTTWERYKPGLGNTVTIETGASPTDEGSLSPAMGVHFHHNQSAGRYLHAAFPLNCACLPSCQKAW